MTKIIQEAKIDYAEQEVKMTKWHMGVRGANVRSMSNDKLLVNLEICRKKGFLNEVRLLLIELADRGIKDPEIAGDVETKIFNFYPHEIIIAYYDTILRNLSAPYRLVDSALFVYADKAATVKSLYIAALCAAAMHEKPIFDFLRMHLKETYGISDEIFKKNILTALADKKLEDRLNSFIDDLTMPLDEKFTVHKELNDKLWTKDKELKAEVAEKIIEIVDEFKGSLEKEDIKFKIKDIIIVGSNCAYTYTKNSDLDIHIIADTKNLKCPLNLYDKLYSAYRSIFNNKLDIDFYGIPVEIFVEQDEYNGAYSGVYSVKTAKWLKEPDVNEVPKTIDETAVDKKFEVLEAKCKTLIAFTEEVLKSGAVKENYITDIEKLIENIYDARKKAISKDGEFSIGNLVFKKLRDTGLLKQLKDLKFELCSKNLSLEEKFESKCKKLSYFADNLPVFLEESGMFRIYNLQESQAQPILRQLRAQSWIEFAQSSNSIDKTRTTIYGKISL